MLRWICTAIHITPHWKSDYQNMVNGLLADQLHDGSWHHGSVATIRHLFGLHLTVRSSSVQIEAALNWLLNKLDLQREKIHVEGEDFAVIAANDLVNAVAEEGSAVEVGRVELLGRDDSVLYHGYLHKRSS